MQLPPPIVPLAEVALIDEQAAASGIAIDQLMLRAGQRLAEVVDERVPDGAVLVVTGSGNNGGDGWIAAAELSRAGRQVQVWPVSPPRSELCRWAAERAGAAVTILAEAPNAAPAVIVDAILGAGVNGPLRHEVVQVLERLAAFRAPVVCADAPTGVNTPHALPGSLTVCFQVAKAELVADPQVDEFITVDIGIPEDCYLDVQPPCLRRFPSMISDGHKGQHGQVLVIGGGRFPGALELSARAALLTGCDLVHAWTADGPPLPPSLVTHRQPGPTLSPADPDTLTALLLRTDALLIGPGIGRGPGAPEAAIQAFELARDLDLPVVVDADGITALARAIREMPITETPVIITPHRNEARTLLDADPTPEAIHRFARPDRVVIRKGKVDLVTNGLRWQRNQRGNPRMAVGGTGDILAGLTTGLLARGASPFDACRMALLWETDTADRLWLEQGPCYGPEEILAELPASLRYHLQALDCWPPV